jgi:hypothetical protein
MTKKTGHNHNRDPYPWDGAETLANAASWTCCDMNLSPTYLTCPMCDKERDVERAGRDNQELGL